MGKEEIIKELIEESLSKIGLKVDNVFYGKEDNNFVLRVTIDKDPYIDVDDCVAATKTINPILDEVNIISDTYVLDVCSKERGGDK